MTQSTDTLHPDHPYYGLTANELRSRIYELSAQIADHEARIKYGNDADLAECYGFAVESCRHLLDEAVRLLGH